MFAFFSLSAIEILILLAAGLLLIGVPVVLVIVLQDYRKKEPDERRDERPH
jgi:hypothetical protein